MDKSHILADFEQFKQNVFFDDRPPPAIRFTGDEGIDGGGLLRTWYQLLVGALVDEKLGLFVLVDGSHNTYTPHMFYGNGDPERTHDLMLFTGKLIRRMIIDGQALGISFSHTVYKYLLGENKFGLENLQFEDPEVYTNLH